MFTKMLYPTDFSDVSHLVVPYLKSLGKTGTRQIVLLHILDERAIDAVYRQSDVPLAGEVVPEFERRFREMLEEGAQRDIEPVASELKAMGLKVKVRLERGIPAKRILEVIEEEKVDAVILGSHGKSNLKEMILGSVSENVIRNSHRPVIVIKR